MNYADIKTIDIQDGVGVRVSIYVSGCHFHCKGCHNPEAWDFHYGKKFDDTTIQYILDEMNKPYIAGLSILGGEPLEPSNQKALVPLVKKVKETYPNKTIWCYTGYDFDKDILQDMYLKNAYTKKLLAYIDILVDGQFIEEQKIVDLKFRGSTNQRKIDVKASLEQNKTISLLFGDEQRYTQKVPKVFVLKENQEEQEQNPIHVQIPVMEKNIVPFSPEKIGIEPIEEKIVAKNIDNSIEHRI